MSKYFFYLFFLASTISYSQTYVKINGVTAIALLPHIGVETSLSDKMTFQFDVSASFWKSVDGAPLRFALFTPEVRYYIKEKYKGWYFGAHIGGAIFKLKKWNYKDLNLYQKGFSYFIGATIGYQKQISDKINLDFFLGGGNIQSSYKGYDIDSGIRYDIANGYNKSSEFIPYRGGIMISYRLN
ncbi:DUF3575 domain-containing protein [Flavobacterium sp.]|uniref:DUF3575 domain-containing protein n=1 Tax=Flavobacterium sp. TaxID=239 RepID=UPI00286E4FAD|nr:DUF3575 domain-containing protein [Flavobacterium sp.]